MKRYIPILALTSILTLSAPISPTHADGFLGMFGKDKQAEQAEAGENANTIYNRKNTNSSSDPIFLKDKDGGRNTKSRGSNTQNTYNNYSRNQGDSADAMPEHFREYAERIEAEEKARLAARQTERERIIDKMNKEHAAWLADLERKEREEAKKLEAEANNLETGNYTIPDNTPSSHATQEESAPIEEGKKKYIYKKPETSDTPDRVFKNFR